eukprot:CAMPEP_0117664964 /NCGR_PEP_ID=MMETSP0804-20121206/9531_1 /TAXON_ID=1074897 /ORGANISM="Tetraselmis astigmatica, Strain CCMP880" /LENGTH=165 /DNA_ID=CAMNT_0005472293 /DNA_START=89 /DNA_END=586 /DNA_ORIENTATION=-
MASVSSISLGRPVATLRCTQRRATTVSRKALKVVAHCQVPCGIFDDKRQLQKVKEDATTIRKACTEMTDLADAGATTLATQNTFTRWVMYKEKHADSIIEEMGYYFMCQRFPKWEFASQEDYLAALELHHKVMIAAMKAKQGTGTDTCDALEAAIDAVMALPMYQ